MSTSDSQPLPLYRDHPRSWRDFHYVYPVLSRRSGGLSIGVNLNPDKVCNWDCVYCQVDRDVAPTLRHVDLGRLRDELHQMLTHVTSNLLWQEPPFDSAPEKLRRVNDIAFSGDGEPTTYERFDEACAIAIEARNTHSLADVKPIVLTNMTVAHREIPKRGLQQIAQAGGEIWAKLETGTAEDYKRIDRSSVPFARILENLLATGRCHPLVIQSMFMRLEGQPLTEAGFDAYLDRLAELHEGGCQIDRVQLYTIARRTAEITATALTDAELAVLGQRLADRLPHLSYRIFGTAG